MSGGPRKLARAALAGMRSRSKHITAALKTDDIKDWPEHRQNAFAYLMSELFHLKTDAERARFVLAWSEGVFETGQKALRDKMQKDIDQLTAEIERMKAPKVELVTS